MNLFNLQRTKTMHKYDVPVLVFLTLMVPWNTLWNEIHVLAHVCHLFFSIGPKVVNLAQHIELSLLMKLLLENPSKIKTNKPYSSFSLPDPITILGFFPRKQAQQDGVHSNVIRRSDVDTIISIDIKLFISPLCLGPHIMQSRRIL